MMKKELTLLGVAALAAGGLHGTTALAQEKDNTQELEVYAGELFGDHMTETSLSGNAPRLDDSATYGARYTYRLNDAFGFQLSANYSPSYASHVASGNGNLGLTTVDTDLVWNFAQGFAIKPYTVAGVGYAWANLDTITGTVNGQPVSIQSDNGFTANVGVGAKYFVAENLFVDVEGRYRYMNRIVNPYGQGVNTVQPTLGIGWRF